MRKLLVVSGAEGVDKTMKHLVDFDRSESIRPAGNVSNNIYNSILESRGFDIYGRLRTKTVKDEQIELRIEEGVDLEKDIEVPTIYEDEEKEIKKLPLTTSKWKIGEMEEYNAPVGFAKNPAKEFCSQGNEIYYSYDGEWKSGMMNGYGSYVYSDGLRYDGQYKENRPNGKGTAQYANGTYEGGWFKGKYSQTGKMECTGGSVYTGSYKQGRRDGEGRIDYGVGLYYEGEFMDGKPNGRGKMCSELTGYSFEGTFIRGRACGSGVLITPPPNSTRIVRIWGEEEGGRRTTEQSTSNQTTPTKKVGFKDEDDPDVELNYYQAEKRRIEKELERKAEEKRLKDRIDNTADGYLLPNIVKMYLSEIAEAKRIETERKDAIFGPLRFVNLNEYVINIRNAINADRKQKKSDIANQKKKRQADLRQEIKEARLKAVETQMAEERERGDVLGNVMRKVGFSSRNPDDETNVGKEEEEENNDDSTEEGEKD